MSAFKSARRALGLDSSLTLGWPLLRLLGANDPRIPDEPAKCWSTFRRECCSESMTTLGEGSSDSDGQSRTRDIDPEIAAEQVQERDRAEREQDEEKRLPSRHQGAMHDYPRRQGPERMKALQTGLSMIASLGTGAYITGAELLLRQPSPETPYFRPDMLLQPHKLMQTDLQTIRRPTLELLFIICHVHLLALLKVHRARRRDAYQEWAALAFSVAIMGIVLLLRSDAMPSLPLLLQMVPLALALGLIFSAAAHLLARRLRPGLLGEKDCQNCRILGDFGWESGEKGV